MKREESKDWSVPIYCVFFGKAHPIRLIVVSNATENLRRCSHKPSEQAIVLLEHQLVHFHLDVQLTTRRQMME